MSEKETTKWIWVFSGSPRLTTSGVFSTRAKAEYWIKKHRLTGVLTPLPLDRGNYDYAVAYGYFSPSKPHHYEPQHIATFSNATNEHYHFEDGECQNANEVPLKPVEGSEQ